LREVEAPTLLRQTANRWRQGCQPYGTKDLESNIIIGAELQGSLVTLLYADGQVMNWMIS
jgi:hypothetical protein